MTRPLLFTALRARGIELPNRIMISPMAIYSAVEGVANDFHFAHHGRFVLGGAGTILVEATAVTREGRITNGDTGLWDDGQIAPFRRITDFMRAHGVVPGIQLAHAGRKGAMQRPWDGNGPLTPENITAGEQLWQPVGPTAEPLDQGWLTPRQLTVADLAKLKDDWVAAAGRALKAGFDWLEIHNAHGYLIHQFLSPLSNTRSDGYGGDFEGRVRFPLELATALRETWPTDRPVSLRISAVDGDALGWQMADSVEYARRLKRIGIDFICTSSGGLRGSATNARVRRDYGYHVPYAAEIRREAGNRHHRGRPHRRPAPRRAHPPDRRGRHHRHRPRGAGESLLAADGRGGAGPPDDGGARRLAAPVRLVAPLPRAHPRRAPPAPCREGLSP